MTALLKEKTLRLSGVMNNIDNVKNNMRTAADACHRLRDEIKVFEFWKNAFSNKGIKTVLLDRFCNGMNSILAGLVAEISGGSLSVWLSPTSLTASGELRNRLSINMKVKGISRSFESLSGGGQKRVALCLCLALHRWVGLQYDTGDLLGVMFFDEVFSFMDECGEEATALRLQEEAKTKFIGIVTHTPDLSSYADNVVVVKGGIDGSVIEGGV